MTLNACPPPAKFFIIDPKLSLRAKRSNLVPLVPTRSGIASSLRLLAMTPRKGAPTDACLRRGWTGRRSQPMLGYGR
jgi:hypothetical protein